MFQSVLRRPMCVGPWIEITYDANLDFRIHWPIAQSICAASRPACESKIQWDRRRDYLSLHSVDLRNPALVWQFRG
jgi:hypothetical protein